MSAMRLRSPRPPRNDEERILPLINIVFLLLIFFMVAGRLAASDPFPIVPPHSSSEGMVDTRDLAVFVAADGRTLRVSATLEPVYELKGYSRIGFRMIQRVVVVRTDEELPRSSVTHLGTNDVLQVDLATLARGMDRLRAESGGEQQLSLIVPLSYVSLASQRGRTELVKLLKEATAMLRCGVICEINDVEGVPAGALLAAVSLIKPFTLLTVGRLLAPTKTNLEGLRGAGLNAVSFDSPAGLSDPEFTAWARATLTVARGAVRSVLVYGVVTPRRAAELALLGASHASLSLR